VTNVQTIAKQSKDAFLHVTIMSLSSSKFIAMIGEVPQFHDFGIA